MNTITCNKCGNKIEIDKALEGQIEERVLAAERHKHKEELEKIERESKESVEKQLEEAKQKAKDAAVKKVEQQLKEAAEDKKDSDERIAKLTEQLTELTKELRDSKKTAQEAVLNAEKKLSTEADKIREEAEKSASEKSHIKQLELEKKLADTQKSLEEANRKANQGSQQNQGEVLELELEQQLASEFPLDGIEEVKKGAKGADIKQTVKTDILQSAGLLLWETKNGKWQPAWVPKFKNDIREAGASIGVIVATELPPEFGEMQNIEKNVWAVKPKLAVMLASALRSTILQVDAMSKMNVGKDAKMEALFTFISGPEFRHRIEAVVENYGQLQDEIEKEKRASQLRWSRQEKSIRAVIDNTIGMYGDLQGITRKALPPIKSLELETGEEEI